MVSRSRSAPRRARLPGDRSVREILRGDKLRHLQHSTIYKNHPSSTFNPQRSMKNPQRSMNLQNPTPTFSGIEQRSQVW